MPSVVRTAIKLLQFLLAIGALAAVSVYLIARSAVFDVVINSTGSSRFMPDSSVVFFIAMSVFTICSLLTTLVVWFFGLFSSSQFKTMRTWLPIVMNTLLTLLWVAAGFTLIPIHLEAADNRDEITRQIKQLRKSPFNGLPTQREFNERIDLWSRASDASLAAIIVGALLFSSYLVITILLFVDLESRGTERKEAASRDRRPSREQAIEEARRRVGNSVNKPIVPKKAKKTYPNPDKKTSWSSLETYSMAV
jgi:hypothetical protein